MSTEDKRPFVLSQIEEALEERQTPDRRKQDESFAHLTESERRKGDRRTESVATEE